MLRALPRIMKLSAPITAPTTAAHFLDGLQECGIEHLFCNLGTDHV